MSVSIKWLGFAPIGSGSFGRNDMGVFCEVGKSLFVIPQFEMTLSKLSKAELEARIAQIVQHSSSNDDYELLNDQFEISSDFDWREKISSSSITLSRWK